MGRSKLQGTPWHYEYTKGKGTNNSKNCAFNTGGTCSCKISPNHNNPCIGKLDCEEFERSSFRNTNINKQNNKNPANIKQEIKVHKNPNKSSNKTVKLGDNITIKSQRTQEEIVLNISDNKNPFYNKSLYDVVLIKGEKYKIIKISNR